MAESGYTYQGDEYYCYPGTAVLRNKQGIRDSETLSVAERKITILKILMLLDSPIGGNFDLSHLCAIHRFLFGDIYEWAGNTRQGEFLMKGSSIFCRGQYIKNAANTIFGKLKKEHYLRNLEKSSFIERLAYYMGEVNALHPFREGNGRAAREFFRELAKAAKYNLEFKDIEKDDLLAADIAAFQQNYDLLIKLLDKAVRKAN
jgi:cell filamentation protein